MNEELIKKVYGHFEGVWPINKSDSTETIVIHSEPCQSMIIVAIPPSSSEANRIFIIDDDYHRTPKWEELTKADFNAYSESLRAGNINWNEAPEGATAYCDSSAYPWLKKDSKGEVSFYDEAKSRWQVYATPSNGTSHYGMAIKKPQDEPTAWQPKVGEECEAAWGLTPDMWGSAVYIGDYFLFEFEEGKFMKMEIKGLKNLRFRPIKTERDQLIEIIDSCSMSSGVLADAILNAGYRKTEEGK